MQNPPAAAQQAQAVDLSNLFAGIWMDDEGAPESGELAAESGSCLKSCSPPGLQECSSMRCLT